MQEIAFLIIGLLVVYVYASTFLFWYWAFKGNKEITKGDKNKYYYVFVGSLIGVGIFLYVGFDKALFFIPSSWGGFDEDGYFYSTKGYLAGVLAFATTVFIHTRPYKLVQFFKSKED